MKISRMERLPSFLLLSLQEPFKSTENAWKLGVVRVRKFYSKLRRWNKISSLAVENETKSFIYSYLVIVKLSF
jgi:hypothetical protein